MGQDGILRGGCQPPLSLYSASLNRLKRARAKKRVELNLRDQLSATQLAAMRESAPARARLARPAWMHRKPQFYVSRPFAIDQQDNSRHAQVKIASRYRLASAPRWRCAGTGSSRLQENAVVLSGCTRFHGPLCRVAQNDIHAHGESPSRPGYNWPSEDQDVTIFVLVQYVETRAPVVWDAVQLQQLGDKGP